MAFQGGTTRIAALCIQVESNTFGPLKGNILARRRKGSLMKTVISAIRSSKKKGLGAEESIGDRKRRKTRGSRDNSTLIWGESRILFRTSKVGKGVSQRKQQQEIRKREREGKIIRTV